jgi:hypothetical protein
VGTSLSVWTLFSGGAILYLQNTINTLGMSMVVESLIEGEATPDAIQEAEKLVNALPLKLVLGIVATLVIMSIAATLISKKTGHFTVKAIIGMTAAGMCMVMGYFLVESFMYSPIAATFSIPPNLLQFFGGVIAAGILAPAIKRLHPSWRMSLKVNSLFAYPFANPAIFRISTVEGSLFIV